MDHDYSLPLPMPSTQPTDDQALAAAGGYDEQLFYGGPGNVGLGITVGIGMDDALNPFRFDSVPGAALPLLRPPTPPLAPFTPSSYLAATPSPHAHGAAAATRLMSPTSMYPFNAADVFSGEATSLSAYSYSGPSATPSYPSPPGAASGSAGSRYPITRSRARTVMQSVEEEEEGEEGEEEEEEENIDGSGQPKNGLPPTDPSDWRARLRYCEQAPHKASLDAGLVRLLEFPEGLDAQELAARRAANLRFDRVREQRLKDRNNEAAKRSRQRKVARIEAAEQQIAALRRERAQLAGEVAALRRQLAAAAVAHSTNNNGSGSNNNMTMNHGAEAVGDNNGNNNGEDGGSGGGGTITVGVLE